LLIFIPIFSSNIQQNILSFVDVLLYHIHERSDLLEKLSEVRQNHRNVTEFGILWESLKFYGVFTFFLVAKQFSNNVKEEQDLQQNRITFRCSHVRKFK
jgi:hypothetical protein